jgi:hypothetical protein
MAAIMTVATSTAAPPYFKVHLLFDILFSRLASTKMAHVDYATSLKYLQNR